MQPFPDRDFFKFQLNPDYGYIPRTKVERHSKTHVFRILFKDSTVLTLNGTIDSYKNRFFLAINNDIAPRSIPSHQTLSLTRVDESIPRVGFATDSCWLFKFPGTINAYSVLAEENVDFTIAIQEGDGPIVPLTKKNLISMMHEYFPSTHQLVKEDKLHHALLQYNKLSARKRKR
jgi:hypothetical protein